MLFRADKKFSRDVFIYDPIGTDKDGENVSLLDVLETGEREILETVIRLRYGLFGTKEHTQREIAEQLGNSRSYVSRIEKRAVGHMREAFYEPAGNTR